MNTELLLTIAISFLGFLSTIIAFFSKKTLESITDARLELADVRLELAKLIANHDATEERSRKNEIELERHRDRLHKLEGQSMSVLNFINEYNN